MRAYIGFDDTDLLGSEIGTGKLARSFAKIVPDQAVVWGVVRQQLLVDPAIPYTSHNSSACVVVKYSDPALTSTLLKLAVEHIEHEAIPGSDPGLCFVCDGHSALAALQDFGRRCTAQVVTQQDAVQAAGSAHLSGHGGTGGGIIGAAAAVGLTASGWSGRFIEFSGLRNFAEHVTVSALWHKGIRVVSLDRDANLPRPEDSVNTRGWLRPRLWGGQAVLPVVPCGPGRWESLGEKRKKDQQKTKED